MKHGTFSSPPYVISWSSAKRHGREKSHPATPNPVVSFSRRAAECALVQAISCLACINSLFSLIGPLGSESQLSIVRFYSVLQMILRTLRSIPLFCYAKRGYLALHHPKPRTNRFPVDDGELAAACAIAFRKQCLLWCLVRRTCSKNCMLPAPKQRLTF